MIRKKKSIANEESVDKPCSGELYRLTDIKIRLDKKTGKLCLFTMEKKTVDEEEHKVLVKETNVKDSNNIIRWLGSPKPGVRGWAKNYLNKDDYQRYGLVYSRIDIFEEANEEYDEDRVYTKEELVGLIDKVNQQRKKKKEITFEEGEQK